MNKRLLCLLLAVVLVFSNAAFVLADSMYTVKPGDVLWKIAEGNGMTWQQLAEVNKLENPHLIYPGQVLKLDGKAAEAVSSASTGVKTTTNTPAALRPHRRAEIACQSLTFPTLRALRPEPLTR
jgi:hypothetical protein